MAYTVDSTRVDAEIATLADHVRKAWQACLGEIAANPHPRFGTYVDRVIPILGFPMRTWIYEIEQETNRLSGETVLVFTGDFFPEYAPVYIVNEAAAVVVILFLRDNRRA